MDNLLLNLINHPLLDLLLIFLCIDLSGYCVLKCLKLHRHNSTLKDGSNLRDFFDALIFDESTDDYLIDGCSDQKIRALGVFDYEILSYYFWKEKESGKKVRKSISIVRVLSRDHKGEEKTLLYKIEENNKKICKIE